MSSRLTAAAVALMATFLAACSNGADVATAPDLTASAGRGSSGGTSFISVGGTWAATLPGGTTATADSTSWSLFLNQNGEKLEGSLIRTTYIAGVGYTGISAIKRGFVAGQGISLEFDRGEGAETATTFSATVSDDLRSMTGFHSRYNGSVTLVRR